VFGRPEVGWQLRSNEDPYFMMYDKGRILVHLFEIQRNSIFTLCNTALLVLLYFSAMSFGISGVALVTGAGESL